MQNPEDLTDFGFEMVSPSEKGERVTQVFDRVARRYDLMNDLMSLGIHRIWKRFAIARCALKPGQKILDLAGGTGDLAQAFVPKVGPHGQVILTDINREMLSYARERLIVKGLLDQVDLVLGSAEALPFANNSFDCISICFGLRNVTDKDKALRSMWQALKPGGRLVILEFSKPSAWVSPFYDAYSFSVLPQLGKWLLNDPDSYQYLAESIRMHPDQETLLSMMQAQGFSDCQFQNLNEGIVALHWGFKY